MYLSLCKQTKNIFHAEKSFLAPFMGESSQADGRLDRSTVHKDSVLPSGMRGGGVGRDEEINMKERQGGRERQ